MRSAGVNECANTCNDSGLRGELTMGHLTTVMDKNTNTVHLSRSMNGTMHAEILRTTMKHGKFKSSEDDTECRKLIIV